MKQQFSLFLAILSSSFVSAQWTYDPANPQPVCTAACPQSQVRQVADGNGGAFVFWLDSRESCGGGAMNDVYGQHFNSSGVALWEENGREIVNFATNIWQFEVVRSAVDGEMIIGTLTDSLRFQKLDNEGAFVWPNQLLVAKPDGCALPTYILGISNFRFLRDDSGYVVSLNATYCGGSNGNRITRFNSAGVLTGPFYGEQEGDQYYNGSPGFDRTYDGSNDVYQFYSNGNGAGAHASCLKVNLAGDTVWGPFDVLEGTNGLNYNFLGMSDENGVAFCFQSNGDNGTGADIFLRKLNTNGTWAWSGNTTTVCGAMGGQGNIFMQQDDDFYYVCWSDGRPGLVCGYSDIYAQKINKATGEVMWTEDGIAVFEQCTYIPYPKCVVMQSGDLIVCNESTQANLHFNAQLINPEGTLAWESNALLSETLPFYSDYQLITSGDNVLVAWARSYAGGGTDDIFIARIAEPDNTVYVNEEVTACNSYAAYGVVYDQSGVYEIELPGDTLVTLNLTINSVNTGVTQTDATLTAEATNSTFEWINCEGNMAVGNSSSSYTATEDGLYAVIVTTGECTDTSACYQVIIPGTNDFYLNSETEFFPNPFENVLTIRSRSKDLIGQVEVMDVFGRMVFSMTMNRESATLELNALPAGSYVCRVHVGDRLLSAIVVKRE